MKVNWRIFYILIIIPYVTGNVISAFVKDYYLRKGVKQIAIFACWDLFERINFVRKVMEVDIKISYLSIYSIDTDIKIFLKVNYYKLGILLDLDCPASEEIFYRFTSNHLSYNESYFWMITIHSDVIPYKILQSMPLSINAEITLALGSKKNSYTLYDVYNPSYRHRGKLNVTYMGNWSTENNLIVELTQYKYKRRGNLYGMALNFSIGIDDPPIPLDMDTYITTPIDNHLDTMHRFSYALTQHFREYFNLTINLLRAQPWGYKLINGSFNGILGDMIRGIVDISVTPFRFKEERMDVLEYTVNIWNARPMVIFRHPKKNNLHNHFIKPFSHQIWFLSALVTFLNWFLLYLTVKVEQHYENYHEQPIITLHNIPASETALIITAAVCHQGLSDGPKLYSGRIVFISVFVWALLLYQFYSASIVGSLLAVSPRFITTPKTLLESTLDLGVEDIAYNHDFFDTDLDPIVRELNRRKVMPNKHRKTASYFSPEEGLKKVQKGGFAFHVDLDIAYKIIENTFSEDEICELQEIKLLYPSTTYIVTPKHSPFKKMVVYGMRQMIEKGLSNRFLYIWRHRQPQCPESHNSLPTPVALNEFVPVLFMLLTGNEAAKNNLKS